MLPQSENQWILASFLGIIGGALTAFGLVLVKYSLLRTAGGEERVYYLQGWWIAGFTVFCSGQLVNVASMAFAPQIYLSCLGAVSLVFNVAFAQCVLKETVVWQELCALGGILLGNAMVIASFAQGYSEPMAPDLSLSSIARPLSEASLTSVTFCICLLIPVCWLASIRLAPSLLPVYWSVVAALISGYTVTFFKCFARLCVFLQQPLEHLEPWCILAVAVAFSIIQGRLLTVAFTSGDALTVVPTYFALSLLAQILMAELVYHEVSALGRWQALCYFTGVELILCSVAGIVRMKLFADIEEQDALLLLDNSERETGQTFKQPTAGTPLLRQRSPRTSPDETLIFGSSGPQDELVGTWLDIGAFPESFENTRYYTLSTTHSMGLA
mmetsp:Transcript_62655/g.136060  ORF Transcript_62655/g.136060 Transcript_62655/m.136060 type:complete len:385 (+) Transcript_62655:108-1262(+)|eukprot:CAMPEP_0170577250 /NCGR_PEP_ID=MMETSP0224-20130122/4825_1 /TAXON_ID=285029 /ORGANISM="Togula jolla, Strain CCCM 725" /LENGTH=384 /DNA_ID=CAMNT_0010900145 /DNA_START=22 /DNA_END=1176 /DNA_ORIENTATION=-